MKLSYFVVFVRSMERSISFYRDVLDLEVAYRYSEEDGTEVAFLVEKGEVPMRNRPMIELVTVPLGGETRPSGFLIGLEVESLADKSRLLQENGYSLTKGPYSPDTGFAISEFKGPDGEDIGLMQVDWAATRPLRAGV